MTCVEAAFGEGLRRCGSIDGSEIVAAMLCAGGGEAPQRKSL